MRFVRTALFLVPFILTGCGGSLYEGLGDDKSPEARRMEAQRALDKGDCAAAVALFEPLQAESLQDINHRLDLAAAYLCQAGFSVQGLLKVVSDFSKDKAGTKNSLFKNITEQVSAIVPDKKLWQANVCQGKALLGMVQVDSKPDEWPCTSATDPQSKNIIFFQNSRDTGYILTIVNLADATLTIVDAINTLNGVATCVKQTGVINSGCEFTTTDLLSIASALLSAQQSVNAATGQGTTDCSKTQTSDISATTYNVICSADTSKDGVLKEDEVLNYLLTQKIITTTDTTNITVPSNCSFDSTQGKYTCTPLP